MEKENVCPTAPSDDNLAKVRHLTEELEREKKGRLTVDSDHTALMVSLLKFMSPTQIAKCRSDASVDWNKEDMACAMALYEAGPRAYLLLLSRGYPTPSVAELSQASTTDVDTEAEIQSNTLGTATTHTDSRNNTPWTEEAMMVKQEIPDSVLGYIYSHISTSEGDSETTVFIKQEPRD